jgi:hypothetical protein
MFKPGDKVISIGNAGWYSFRTTIGKAYTVSALVGNWLRLDEFDSQESLPAFEYNYFVKITDLTNIEKIIYNISQEGI